MVRGGGSASAGRSGGVSPVAQRERAKGKKGMEWVGPQLHQAGVSCSQGGAEDGVPDCLRFQKATAGMEAFFLGVVAVRNASKKRGEMEGGLANALDLTVLEHLGGSF